jgi:exopolysaccharide production protein ExoQ
MGKLFRILLPYWIVPYYLWTTLPPRPVAILWLGTLYLLAYVFLLTKGKRILSVLLSDRWIVALILISGLSVFWSVAPGTTFASTRSLIVQYILVGYLVTTYSLKQIIGIIAKVLCCTGLLSLFYVLFLPQIAIRVSRMTGGEGAWQGIFPHQSVLAGTMAIAIISLVYTLVLQGKRWGSLLKLAALLVTAVCLYLLVFCGAKTAMMGFLASFAILPFFFLGHFKGMKTRNAMFLGLIYFFFVGLPILYSFKDFIIVELLGKSATLSGRSILWDYLLTQVANRPLGHGLDAFWHNQALVRDSVRGTGGYLYGNSHSNYMDLLVGIGLPGVVVLSVCVVGAIQRSIVLAFTYRQLEFRWALQILVCLLIASYSDVFIGFLASRTIGWFLFCVISLSSILELQKIKQQSQRPEYAFIRRRLATAHAKRT